MGEWESKWEFPEHEDFDGSSPGAVLKSTWQDWDDHHHGHHHHHRGYAPFLDHLGQDCFAACHGATGKCPSNFCGTGGWCCRWGVEWDTPGCYHVGCHGKHCCTHRGDFSLHEAVNATEVMV